MKKIVTMMVFGIVILANNLPVGGYVVDYTNDFSAWVNANEAAVPGYEFGPWLVTGNSTMLSWDLTVVAGFAVQRWNSYTIMAPDTITSIEFDWRFANDRYDRIASRLLDASNNVLWSATSTYGGWEHPWNLDEVVATNTTSLRFEYRQVVDPIYGQPGLFASNADDWDAAIDNVSLTIIPEPVTLLLVSTGVLLLRRKLSK